MNIYAPNYYNKFKCIADKCQHSCCIGWEIDIDSDTLEYYNSLNGSIGDRLSGAISCDDEPHFVLSEHDRCPFLNKTGLCDIITELGEDSLCNICADHPRFRNYYSNSVELGLGLCCEAATELIINNTESFEIISLEACDKCSLSELESFVLNKRKKLIEIIKDRTKTIEERHKIILDLVNASIDDVSFNLLVDFFLKLEQLDPIWTNLLNKVKNANLMNFFELTEKEYSIKLEQLTIYFLYRHVPLAIEDGFIDNKVKFAVISTRFIYALATFVYKMDNAENKSFESVFLDICRTYSSEIEYSDENIEKCLEI